MTTTITNKYGLTFIEEGQDNAEVTFNDDIVILEAMACINVIDRDLSAPPGSPVLSDAYFVAAGASGAWAGHSNEIAIYNGNNWVFAPLPTGCSVYVQDEGQSFIWNGAVLEDPLASLNIPIDDGSELGLRIVIGHTNAAGGIVRGTGFSVAHVIGSADYFYTFSVPFGTIPIIIPAIFGTKTSAQAGTSSQGLSTTSAQIGTLFFAFGGVDTPHSFIAIG